MRTVNFLLPTVAAATMNASGALAAPTVSELYAQGKFCSATAEAVFRACSNESLDDYWIGYGICINESDVPDRSECFADLGESRREASDECAAQRVARTTLCKQVGEGRYDPEFEETDFDSDFSNLTNPNPYFPLAIGNRWEYSSAEETDVVQVLNRTKLIDDVRCIVVRDEVFEDGVLHEGTNDWFAQAKDGTVWYCGEETASFEVFEGDRQAGTGQHRRLLQGGARRRQARHHLSRESRPRPGLHRGVVARQCRGRNQDPLDRLLVRQEHKSRSARTAAARATAVQEELRGHAEHLAAGARRSRTQVLRAGHRRIPRDSAADGRSRATGEVQLRPALLAATALTRRASTAR